MFEEEVGELTVFCPKEGKDVPVWHCAGSYVQGRSVCSNLIEISINYPERKAERKCALDSCVSAEEREAQSEQEGYTTLEVGQEEADLREEFSMSEEKSKGGGW